MNEDRSQGSDGTRVKRREASTHGGDRLIDVALLRWTPQ